MEKYTVNEDCYILPLGGFAFIIDDIVYLLSVLECEESVAEAFDGRGREVPVLLLCYREAPLGRLRG
jgi:hypothetical protein